MQKARRENLSDLRADHWMHHRQNILLLELWEVKSGEENSRLRRHFIWDFIDLSGFDKSWKWVALAFSAPHSLTKPIFLCLLLVLSAQLKITLRRATFFPSFAQYHANIRSPSESWLLWDTLLPLSPQPFPHLSALPNNWSLWRSIKVLNC